MYQQYLTLLREYIAFPSVSTDSAFKSNMTETAHWLQTKFIQNGFAVDVVENYGNPIVVARYHHDDALPTVLIYGHYDVQPAAQEDGRQQDPFLLQETETKLIARGAIDNKGQCAVHMTTVFHLIKENNLAYNVVFMVEGDEETGSPLLPKFIEDNQSLLKADFALISDGELVANKPNIETGFRGGFNATLTIRTATTDLHSGAYGGVAPSSSHEMTAFLAKIHDPETYVVQIPGFYDDVIPLTDQEQKNSENVPFDPKQVQEIIGAKAFVQDKNFIPWVNLTQRPTVQVTGVQTGYTGEGYKNGIPATATAKINFRLVSGQSPEHIVTLFCDFVKKNIPTYVTYDLQINDPYPASRVDINNSYVTKAQKHLEDAYQEDVVFVACGGGLPIVGLFEEFLGLTNVLVPFASNDCNMHGVDENFDKELLHKALDFSLSFLRKE